VGEDVLAVLMKLELDHRGVPGDVDLKELAGGRQRLLPSGPALLGLTGARVDGSQIPGCIQRRLPAAIAIYPARDV
jgi:hypothetical protein